MTEADLLAGDASDITPERYPETITARAVELPLDYSLSPGESDDGVTVTVPIEALNQLDADQAEWLVPGLLKEKIVALIKSMPKNLRTNFVPAPTYADKVIPRLSPSRGPLTTQLRDALHAITGVPIPASAIAKPDLPDHLRMRIRVVDSDGKELATSRDVTELRNTLGVKAREARRSPRARLQPHKSHRLGSRRSPKVRRVHPCRSHRPRLPGHHRRTHRQRTRRMPPPLRRPRRRPRRPRPWPPPSLPCSLQQRAQRPGKNPPGLRYNGDSLLGIRHARRTPRSTKLRTAELSFLPDSANIRTRAEWESRLDFGWNRLQDATREVCRVSSELLAQLQRTRLALEAIKQPAHHTAKQNIETQLARLTQPHFLTITPWQSLTRYPTYFAAASERLTKLHGNERRDAELSALVTPFQRACDQKTALHLQTGVIDPELENLRWMIEEYRVSLWAQRLGVAQTVSPQRLEKQWKKTIS